MKTVSNTYPGFKHAADELSAFSVSIDTFVISLKNRKLINFTPENTVAFYDWLIANNIRDIRKNETKEVTPPTPSNKGWKDLFKRKKSGRKL
ncbi:hypothetical protein [Parapedobacter sp. 10938]|uniref:hypothetical protein n=1 Tax=Parapedobacter flavus TaxID=3110225 RepID=UPI002DBF8702|nr:hypothetical protein [Parapedobacter sp. 10938]MEC3880282.1 hypothetical protein [Parapedobacter sp. 10938]